MGTIEVIHFVLLIFRTFTGFLTGLKSGEFLHPEPLDYDLFFVTLGSGLLGKHQIAAGSLGESYSFLLFTNVSQSF